MPLFVSLLMAPGDPAHAQTRAFQMSLWAEHDTAPGVDTDVPVFYDGYTQPAGSSIVIRFDLNKPFTAGEYEWPRIAAVLIDEPYNDFNSLPTTCWSQAQVDAVNARAEVLAQRAAELKSVAPMTRFWVNLARPQMNWMRSPQCANQALAPVNVNRAYIDVISVDIYRVDFVSVVKPYYVWLEAHRAKPDQQMALIPATHHRSGDTAAIRMGIAVTLYDYFDYADEANESCDLPFGSRGLTGSFDGCRVWMILGWLAQNHSEAGIGYIGARDPAAGQIATVWQSRRALALRPDLARQVTPGQLVPVLLPLMLE